MKKGKLIFLSVIGLLWIIAFVKVYLFFDKYMNKKADESLSSYEQEPASKREKTAVEEFFFNYIEDLYAEYYDILNIKVYDYMPDGDAEENTQSYFVVIEKKLKYRSVYQLPFVAGMKKAVDEAGGLKKVTDLYNKKTNELKRYIGLKQTENNIFKVIFEEPDNFESAKIRIATYREELSAEALRPASSESIFNNGYKFINFYIDGNSKKNVYDNAAAVRYADKYTSNPINAEVNNKVWNKKYKTYENDCANFVSQCLLAGGIKTTSQWYPESLYWIRTGSPKYASDGITSYMQKRNAFYLTNYNAVSAGGFICLTKESHVVLVTSNDSITVLFNSHTNDRKRVSFPNLGTRDALYLTPNN